ncbi:MAG TPA: Smr/MutS family protein [Candidatus Magasanikbacteria bacterium]|nr:Smr/MutS family protein [Candidatus Magasanikbacteria bacterium]
MSDKNKFLKLSFELGAKIPELDLHGENINETEEKVDQFLYQNFLNGEQAVKIITGGGKGVLKEKIKNYLLKNKLVEEVVDDFGALLVILSK